MQNFELKKSRYVCKICGESVVSKCFRQHIRDNHHDSICKKIIAYFLWSPEQIEKLVRIVGEYIRQNMNPKYLRDNKAINWSHIATKMNHSNDCKLSPYQIRKKWDNMVFRLPEVPIEVEGEQEKSEKNGYVFLIKYLLLSKNK